MGLSRVQSLDQLYLAEPFDPMRVRADPVVLNFYGLEATAPVSAEVSSLLQQSGRSLRGRIFIITGHLPKFPRAQCREFIEQNGGKVVVTLAKTLTDAVVGSKAGPSKLQFFQQNRIRQWNEDELIQMVQKTQKL
jgi:BRCT domain type II-containing protein